MSKYGIDRDQALRGFWVKGLKEVSDYCKKHTFVDDDEIFIPDKLLDLLNDCVEELNAKSRM